MKNLKPYWNCSINQISQPFGNPQSFGGNHTGTDFVGSYGVFLVAPEKVRIKRIITDETFDDKYLENLSKGFGVLMTSISNPSIDYLYWHCLQIFPVKEGQIVERGEAVAQMGNSGLVFTNGKLVPIDLRNAPGFPGTHLHYEVRLNGIPVNPMRYILN